MKRNIPEDGPSSLSHSLFPREEKEPEVKKGGRGVKNDDCFEHGAARGSVKCFFSRKTSNGDTLEEGMWRCCLAHIGSGDVMVKQVLGKGETNLVKHIEDVHGFVKARSDSAPKAKLSKVVGPITTWIDSSRVMPSKDALSFAVYKYVVKRSRPYDLIADSAFQEMLSDVLSLCGLKNPFELRLVDPNTLKSWIARDSSLMQESLTSFFGQHLKAKFWNFSVDEKKATYRESLL